MTHAVRPARCAALFAGPSPQAGWPTHNRSAPGGEPVVVLIMQR